MYKQYIHTGLTWWSIAFTSFLKLSIRVEAIPRLSCPSSSTATLHIYVFWGCLERPRKQLCAARNSRLLAACIILPEICSRGFSLRPLFDACWQYWLQGCWRAASKQPQICKITHVAKVSHGSAYTYTCMHESLASLITQAFSSHTYWGVWWPREYREPQLHSASRIKKNFGTAKGSPFPTNFDCMHNIIAGREISSSPNQRSSPTPTICLCV